jgi:cytochrome c oxidase cbb3-type subunit 3
MHVKNGFLAVAFLGLGLLVAQVSAQNPPAGQAPPAGPPAGRGRAGGGGRGRGPATFPAQQRPAADPAVAARGKALYEANCQSCHAADLRGATGPNLLRSQAVLSDQAGELIAPIVGGSLPNMRAISMSADDVKTLAIYIHDVVRTARNQGAPPTEGVPVESILVGDAAAGKAYFDGKCSTCHSVTGDLQNIGNRFPDAKGLQNFWVSGGSVGGTGGGRGRGGRGAAADDRTPTATITLANGSKVEGPLVNIDDFTVTVSQADGTLKTVTRDKNTKVDVKDPMDAHRKLWASLGDKDMHDVTAYLVTVK